MNLSTHAKRVLCYGDSNTWGYVPGAAQRYSVTKRWTGMLQSLLGADYWVLEEGQNGRTTNLDDPMKPGKNGWTYLQPCIETHNPIDFFILALGTNDLKERYNRSPKEVADVIDAYIENIQEIAHNESGMTPHILLCAPPFVDESVRGVEEKYKGAEEKSKQLGLLYAEVASKYHTSFLDFASLVQPSKIDGYHLDEGSHRKIAEHIFQIVKGEL